MLGRYKSVGLLAVLVAVALCVFAGAASAAPSNDDDTTPVVLSGTAGSVAATNVGATAQADEPSGAVAWDGATVWFAWDAPQNGTIGLGADADLVNTHVAVYAGQPAADSEPVAAAEGGVLFDVVGGTRYFIAVDTEGGTGDFYVDWTFAGSSAPGNDQWAFAQPIGGASGTVSGTNVGATGESGEPAGHDHSVWFHWIAPADGVASFSAGGQTVDAFSGTSLTNLQPLGADAPVVAGEVLSVRVDGSAPSAFTLNWQMSAPPSPVVVVPSSLTFDATAPAGRLVWYPASASDWVGRSLPTSCNPPVGWWFAIGTTTVTCTATDAGGRTASASFDVHVKGVSEQLGDLHATVGTAQLDQKTTKVLTSKLDDVAKQVAAGRTNAECGGLADFVATVQKQSGGSIPAGQADAFAATASRIRTVAGCA